jgi:hypothetical protein
VMRFDATSGVLEDPQAATLRFWSDQR